jgi:hypothetical protein
MISDLRAQIKDLYQQPRLRVILSSGTNVFRKEMFHLVEIATLAQKLEIDYMYLEAREIMMSYSMISIMLI